MAWEYRQISKLIRNRATAFIGGSGGVGGGGVGVNGIGGSSWHAINSAFRDTISHHRYNIVRLNEMSLEGWECIGMDEKHYLLKRKIEE